MASDSRLTLNSTEPLPPTQVQQHEQQPTMQQVLQQVAVGQTDSTNKTFLANNKIGISTYGAADVQGVPISGYIESFINEELPKDCTIDDVPQILLDYFREMPGPPDVSFFVAGYKEEDGGKRVPHVYRVIVVQNHIDHANAEGVGLGLPRLHGLLAFKPQRLLSV